MESQNPQELLNERLGDYARSTPFPSDELPEEFAGWVERAFTRTAPSILSMEADEFFRVYQEQDNMYTLWEMGNILRLLQSGSMYAMDMLPNNYHSMQKMVEVLTIKHRDLIKPKSIEILQGIAKEAQARQQIDDAKEEFHNKTIPLS